jgi:transcriptional regulator with XRE-family HTH domain
MAVESLLSELPHMTSTQLKQLRAASVDGNRLGLAFHLDERTQADCARATGFSAQYINDVKAGRIQNVTVENAHKFAEFFDCAIEDLFPAREAVA